MLGLRRINTRLLSRVVQQRSMVTIGSEDAYVKLKESSTKKILYFTASWCPPCKKIAPVFASMSKDHPSVTFAKIDIDEVPEAAEDNGIRSVPTFQFWSGEKKVGEFVGASEDTLKAKVLALEKE